MSARVLVVHDVPPLRTSMTQALELAGCVAIGVEDFARAAELVPLDPPDVVVTDERVIRDAPDAFRALRDVFGNVLVVALAGPVRRRREPSGRGVHCVIEKPADDDDLVSAVAWVLEVYAAGAAAQAVS